MRTCLLVVVAAALAGCGDASSAPLVNADAPTVVDRGRGVGSDCVVDPTRDVGAGKTWPTMWTVRPGDSLRRIARRVYGDENLWKAIRDANPDKVGRDGQIAVGAVLAIPYDGI